MLENNINDDVNGTTDKKGMGWGAIIAWLLLAMLLLIVGIQLWRAQLGILTVGEVAPEFNLTLFEGGEISPQDWEGKVVLVNIWATWCLGCEREAPILQAAWEYYQDRDDVIFLGVDYADTRPLALEFIENYGVTYPNGPDLGTRIYSDYRVTGLPETFIINQEGIIAAVKIGEYITVNQITTIIDGLLGP